MVAKDLILSNAHIEINLSNLNHTKKNLPVYEKHLNIEMINPAN